MNVKEFLFENKGLIHKMANRFTSRDNPLRLDNEDVVQEAYLKAWKILNHPNVRWDRGKKAVVSYLCTGLRRELARTFRVQSLVKVTKKMDRTPGQAIFINQLSDDELELLPAKGEKEEVCVDEIVQILKEKERTLLFEFFGIKTKRKTRTELAEKHGVCEATINSWVKKVINKIKGAYV